MVIEPEPMASIIVPIYLVKRILALSRGDFGGILRRGMPAGCGMAGDATAAARGVPSEMAMVGPACGPGLPPWAPFSIYRNGSARLWAGATCRPAGASLKIAPPAAGQGGFADTPGDCADVCRYFVVIGAVDCVIRIDSGFGRRIGAALTFGGFVHYIGRAIISGLALPLYGGC